MIVIAASGRRLAFHHLPEMVLGAAFPLLYGLAIHPAAHIPGFAKVIFAIAALWGLVLFAQAGGKFLHAWRTPGQWITRVGPDGLHWQTAWPLAGFPLDLALDGIARTVRLECLSSGTDGDTHVETVYELHLTDGTVRGLDQATAGLNPHRVFRALAKFGVPYDTVQIDRRSDPASTRRISVD